MNKAKKAIIKAFKREQRKERGLRIIESSKELTEAHIKKARHNLKVTVDLSELGHSDWVAVVAYYVSYHAATAVLSRIGLDSKDHATTVAVLEYFFSEHFNKEILKKFDKLKEKKDALENLFIEDKFIDYLWQAKNLREISQYGTNTFFSRSNESIDNTKEFLLKIRSLINRLDEEYINIIIKQIKKVYEESKQNG